MRLVTYRTGQGNTAVGRMEDPEDLRLTPIPGFRDLKELLQQSNWREIANQTEGDEVSVEPTDLAPVVPHPDKIICVGLNYANHIREMGRTLPEVPTLFIKFAEALTGPFDEVNIAPWAQQSMDWEGELAVIIGKDARRVSEEEAGEYIAGYSIINDCTNRDFQNRTLQWHQGKSLEKTAGCGPWLTTADSWTPAGMLRTYLNDEEVQSTPTHDLVFRPEKLVEFISHLYPLRAGDIIATGTPGGVGHARTPQRYLTDGDSIRISIEGLGEIHNSFRFER